MKHLLYLVLLFVAVHGDPRAGFPVWNVSTESWLQFHVRHCGRVCLENQLHEQDSMSKLPCFPCDCDPQCSIYDTCCPRKVKNSYVEPLGIEFSHLPSSSRFHSGNISDGEQVSYYYMISNCDPKFSDNFTKRSNDVLNLVDQCQNPDTKTMDDITPYSDMYYGIVYKNRFCAMCNGYTVLDNVTNVIAINNSAKIASPWSIKVACEHFQTMYHFTSEYEFLKSASHENYDICFVTFQLPNSHHSPKACSVSENMKTDINCTSMNIHEHDFCRNTTARSMAFNGYPNIFCALCAMDSWKFDSAGSSGPALEHTPLFFLLSLTLRGSRQVDGRCPLSSECLSPDGECRKASCSPGKITSPEGHCVTALKGIRGLGYKLVVTLRPTKDVEMTPSGIAIAISHDAIYQKLSTGENNVELTSDVTYTKRPGLRYNVIQSYNFTAYIVANSDTPRDEFERRILQMLNNTWEITINEHLGTKISLKPIFLGNEMNNFLKTVANATTVRESTGFDIPTNILELKESFIDITYSLVCPYVEVNVSKLTVEDWEIHLSFEYDRRNYSVQGGPDISLVEGQVRICLESFKMITKQRSSQLAVILYYFQVICISASVAGLILSLVTYFLFPSMRSLPGLNNISLCVSMSTAHIFLLVTVEYGVEGHLTSGFCLFNAILLHFSWLASFAWMSACCIHMYLVFTSFNLHNNVGTSDRRRHFWYCLYGYGIPAFIVILTLTLSAAMTSGASIGYDDAICFLDTRTSVLTVVMSLLVPLCAMVISNGVMFTLTLRKIFSVAESQKSAIVKERRGLVTYVKLSSLTGIFCIISAAAVWLDNDILQLITCPLMALQGVFIFFSFIVNKSREDVLRFVSPASFWFYIYRW
ncbi:hypothetical protein Btru_010078 [Bulinus truncatus]|nr:hypothetical protein Btru_010078 [Bulinus truncatus]